MSAPDGNAETATEYCGSATSSSSFRWKGSSEGGEEAEEEPAAEEAWEAAEVASREEKIERTAAVS